MKRPLLGYPRRIIRHAIAEQESMLRMWETHIEAVTRRGEYPHTKEECGCIQERKRMRARVLSLKRALALLGVIIDLTHQKGGAYAPAE